MQSVTLFSPLFKLYSETNGDFLPFIIKLKLFELLSTKKSPKILYFPCDPTLYFIFISFLYTFFSFLAFFSSSFLFPRPIYSSNNSFLYYN